MNFQDRGTGSVQSLLAQLRAAQDGAPGPNTDQDENPGPSAKRARHDLDSTSGSFGGGGGGGGGGNVPSSRQLQDLLSSLGQPSQAPPPPSSATTRSLIEPFGPISTISHPSNPPPKPDPRPQSTSTKLGPVDNVEFATMSFTKALPIISNLLSDPDFKAEVKRMKADQDSLERRLWAKGEKVKIEHEKTTMTDKEIAKITGKQISPVKEREWKLQLSNKLEEFYKQSCLPAIDGLAQRHKERLEQLGVPGLGGDMGDPKARERVRRIMDVLEGSLEE